MSIRSFYASQDGGGGGDISIWMNTRISYTAISRKVVGKTTRDDPERYIVGGFEFTVLQKKLEEWHERL